MIDRRTFTVISVCWLCGTSLVVAQSMSRRRRMGILAPGVVPNEKAYPEPLLAGLRDLGWEEGGNLEVERRIAFDRTEQLPALAEELVAANVEVIVTIGTPAALAARNATASIPIVMATIGDPLAVGLVASLARPGGNITGNTFIEPDLSAKRLQLLRELLPAAQRVGELINPANPAMQAFRGPELNALRRVGLQPVFVDILQAKDIGPAFAELVRQRVDALIVHSDSLMISNRSDILRLAKQHSIPTIGEGRTFVEAGAVLSYASSTSSMVRNAAKFVDKILRGAKTTDLPIERPTRFELVINLKTATALGIAIPPSILIRADEVIE